RNVDYAFLIWEDFLYQVEHKNQKKSNEMYYPRFTKVIIHHFMKKKPSIPRRNKVNWHYVRDDILFSTIKVVSRHQNTQQYGAILHIELTTEDIRNTNAYKEYYACAAREAAPKPKVNARRKRGKQPARATSPTDPSDVERTEAEQLKIILKRSRQETHISQQGGSSTDEGTGSKPGVPNVPSDDSQEEISWNSSDEEDVDDQTDDEEEISKIDEQEATESGESDDEETESDRESEEEETREEEEESFDLIPRTPEDDEDDGNSDGDQGLRISEEERIQEEEEADELYHDSSSVSSFVTSMLNPTSDAGVKSIVMTASSPIAPLPTTTPIMTPSTITIITTSSDAPIPPTIIPSTVLENLPTFDSVFHFEDRVKSLEVTFSEFMQTNQFADAVSKIPDKTILESYGDTAIMKRRRGDDDDQEGPSARSDQGSKRRREGGEHESASTPSEPATRSASRSTTGTQSRQMSASKSAFAEEPVQTTCQMDEPPHPVFETGVEDHPIV
nr:hypothetical protein [Tanacetum cinerariifolium]